jgi:hypothetical protein
MVFIFSSRRAKVPHSFYMNWAGAEIADLRPSFLWSGNSVFLLFFAEAFEEWLKGVAFARNGEGFRANA